MNIKMIVICLASVFCVECSTFKYCYGTHIACATNGGEINSYKFIFKCSSSLSGLENDREVNGKSNDQSWEDEHGRHKDSTFRKPEMPEMPTETEVIFDHKGNVVNDFDIADMNIYLKRTYDPEVGSNIENNLVHEHPDMIRTFSGFTSDLKY